MPFVLFGWLLVIDIAPSGLRIVNQNVDEASPFRDRLLPDQRVSIVQYDKSWQPYMTVFDDPTYFSVHLPHTEFESVDVEVEFQNTSQPIVELGALVDIFSQAYDLYPLHNLVIEQLNWPSLEVGEITLYQREQKYSSLEEFIQNLPDRSRIATYFYELTAPYRIADYQPFGSEQFFDVSLRGYHKYKTYIKDEDLVAELVYMDMNRTVGADEVALRVRDESDVVVFEQKFNDDSNTTSNQVSTTKTAIIHKTGLPEGVYTVELSGTSDIFWRSIKSPQRYLTFVNSLYIGDDVGHLAEPRSTQFYTNAKNLTFETFHADATQSLTLGSTEVAIPRSHEKIYYSVEDVGVILGHSIRGDLKMVGDGKFSFSKESFFDPDPLKIGSFTDPELSGIDYLITTYQSPKQKGDWLVGSVRFNLDEVKIIDESTIFTLSAPGILALQNAVDVHAINLRFNKSPLTFSGFLQEIRRRLPFGL
ncbi:MAG: hypothetical protein ABH846_03055 [Patescibacteria group bacterium]